MFFWTCTIFPPYPKVSIQWNRRYGIYLSEQLFQLMNNVQCTGHRLVIHNKEIPLMYTLHNVWTSKIFSDLSFTKEFWSCASIQCFVCNMEIIVLRLIDHAYIDVEHLSGFAVLFKKEWFYLQMAISNPTFL